MLLQTEKCSQKIHFFRRNRGLLAHFVCVMKWRPNEKLICNKCSADDNNTDKVGGKPVLFRCLCKGFVILLIQCCSKWINLKFDPRTMDPWPENEF